MAAAVPHRGPRGVAVLQAPWGKLRKPEEKEEAGDTGTVGGGHMGSIWGAFSAEVCFSRAALRGFHATFYALTRP